MLKYLIRTYCKRLIKDFRLNASEERVKVIDQIVELHQDWLGEYKEQQKKIDEGVRRAKTEWGAQTEMVMADLELFVDPFAPRKR